MHGIVHGLYLMGGIQGFYSAHFLFRVPEEFGECHLFYSTNLSGGQHSVPPENQLRSMTGLCGGYRTGYITS